MEQRVVTAFAKQATMRIALHALSIAVVCSRNFPLKASLMTRAAGNRNDIQRFLQERSPLSAVATDP